MTRNLLHRLALTGEPLVVPALALLYALAQELAR